ncbi:MAG: glycosyl hydrolase family 18 protein [Parcubacteria group bacterium]
MLRTKPNMFKWLIGVLIAAAVIVFGLKPHATNQDLAQLPRPYFASEHSYFARGNFFNLDTEPTLDEPLAKLPLVLAPPEQVWTVAGTNTVSLNWTRHPQATSYQVRYRQLPQERYQTAEVEAPFFTVRNATADATYEFTVATKLEDGSTSKSSPRMAVTPTALTQTTRIERERFEVAAWMPPGWENTDVQSSFERGSGTLTAINPFWYNFGANGRLEPKGSARNTEAIARAHQADMRVLFAITNNYDPARITKLLSDPELQQLFTEDVLRELELYDYEGVDLDFENVSPKDRDAFTKFLIALSEKVHAKGKVIQLTAQPKKSDADNWNGPGALDLNQLRDHIDWFVPMIYDFSTQNGEPGPIAPLPWVDQVLRYWTSKVPKEKILAGLPFYGYDWSLATEDDIGIQYQDVLKIQERYKVEEGFDQQAGEPFIKYSDEDGPRTVYYQNAASVASKVAVAKQYGVAGVAIWLLGGEDPQNFEAIRSTTSTTIRLVQKPLNLGLKVKGQALSVSLTKFPEIDHVTILYGAKPNTLSEKLEKQTTSVIPMPELHPGETRYLQGVAYDKEGHELRRSGIASVSLEQ